MRLDRIQQGLSPLAGAVLGFAVVLLAFAFASTTLRHEWTFWIAVLVMFVAPNFYAKPWERRKPVTPENYRFT